MTNNEFKIEHTGVEKWHKLNIGKKQNNDVRVYKTFPSESAIIIDFKARMAWRRAPITWQLLHIIPQRE